jgi:hypothetical protein
MKKISLTQGQVALVDNSDFDFLNQWKWYAHKKKDDNTFYARRKGNRKENFKTIFMHRVILNIPHGDKRIPDHINRNGLDNRKCNLRIVNHSINRNNSKILSNNTSGYRGVHYSKKDKRWRSRISINGKRINIGTYKDIIDAAKAYDVVVLELIGVIIPLNFQIK